MRAKEPATLLATFLSFAAVSLAQTCNPLSSVCQPNVGLSTSTYSVDFTQQTAVPKDWTLSDYAKLNFGTKGAEFTINQRFDSPQLWSNFYILFGKVETVIQAAPGTGIVSSAVLISDDADEIDWEFSGNNFGDSSSAGVVQNNYYGKGVTGYWDRSQVASIASPQTQFHTYTVDWTPDTITWSVDGAVVRTMYAANADQDSHQYPQTPAKVQLGIWAGGDPGNAWGTVSWAGGYTNFSQVPFTMYVKSVKVTSYNPAYAYNYTDKSGNMNSIQLIKQPLGSSSSATTSTTASTPATSQASSTVSSKQGSTTPVHQIQTGIAPNCNSFVQAISGDYCSKFADDNGITTDQLYAWNTVLGSGGKDCDMQFWANYDYCVGVSSAVTTSSTSSLVASSTSGTAGSSSTSTTSLPSAISSSSSSRSSSTVSSSTATLSTTTISPATAASTKQIDVSTTSTTSSASSSVSATVSVLSCPASNNTIYTASTGANFLIECGVDHQAGDMGSISVRSLEGCIEYCAARAGCVDVSLSGSACYIKKSLGTALSNPGVLGARLITTTSDPSTPASVASSSTAVSSVNAAQASPSTSSTVSSSSSPSSSSTSPGSSYALYSSSDSDQGSYANTAASSSYTDCITSCDSDPKCSAFTYVGGENGVGSGTCWLKSTLGNPVSSGDNVLSGSRVSKGSGQSSSVTTTTSTAKTNDGGSSSSSSVKSSSSATNSAPSSATTSSTTISSSSTSPPTCPTSNNTLYTDPTSSLTFQIECGVDHSGGDLGMTYVTSLASCISACASTTNCVDVSLSGSACYLKGSVGHAVQNGGVQGARLVPAKAVGARKRGVVGVGVGEKSGGVEEEKSGGVEMTGPPWARYLPRGGRWLWNGHGGWDWVWN